MDLRPSARKVDEMRKISIVEGFNSSARVRLLSHMEKQKYCVVPLLKIEFLVS